MNKGDVSKIQGSVKDPFEFKKREERKEFGGCKNLGGKNETIFETRRELARLLFERIRRRIIGWRMTNGRAGG